MSFVFNRLFSILYAVTSKLGVASPSVLLNLTADDADPDAESSAEEAVWSPVLVRPRDKDADGLAEMIAVRGEDCFHVLALRDLRLTTAAGQLAKGSVRLPGYGGGFVSIDDRPDQESSILTAYTPYANKTKAHAVILDTSEGNEAISVVHGAGHAILLTPDGTIIMKNKAGDAFLGVSDSGVLMSGDMKLGNNLVVGDPTAAQNVAIATPLIAVLATLQPIIAGLPAAPSAPQLAAFNAAITPYLAASAPWPLVQSKVLKAQPGA
jgi:hypothetical protein